MFLLSILILITSGVGMAFAPHWALFSLLRICVGFAHPGSFSVLFTQTTLLAGIFMIAVVVGMELVGPKHRKVGSICAGIFFALGQMLLGLSAFFLRDYRHLQLAISLPALLFLAYWWLIPESPRWLVSQRRFEDADKVGTVTT